MFTPSSADFLKGKCKNSTSLAFIVAYYLGQCSLTTCWPSGVTGRFPMECIINSTVLGGAVYVLHLAAC